MLRTKVSSNANAPVFFALILREVPLIIIDLLLDIILNISIKKLKIYKPTIFIRILYKVTKNNKTNIIKTKRNFGVLNKFRKGVKIIKINPNKLLIKNRG